MRSMADLFNSDDERSCRSKTTVGSVGSLFVTIIVVIIIPRYANK